MIMTEIGKAIDQLHGREEVGQLTLDSAGLLKVFFGGRQGRRLHQLHSVPMVDRFHRIFELLLEVSNPVLPIVNWVALGGGCELAAFADLVVATGTS